RGARRVRLQPDRLLFRPPPVPAAAPGTHGHARCAPATADDAAHALRDPLAQPSAAHAALSIARVRPITPSTRQRVTVRARTFRRHLSSSVFDARTIEEV